MTSQEPLTRHAVLELIRDELESRDTKIKELEMEVERWKTASAVVKWGVVAIVGVSSAAASVWEWGKEHIR